MENIIYIALVFGAVIFLIYLWKDKKNNMSTERGQSLEKKEVFPLRMQAYERLTILLERSKPQSLVMRSMQNIDSAKELQLILLNTLREELEHNFSQQIYISEMLWKHIRLTNNRLVQLVNTAATQNSKGTTKAFAEEIFLQYNKDSDFVEQTLEILRKEARSIQK